LSDHKPSSPLQPAVPGGSLAMAGPRRIASQELFGESAVVLIEHQGETYSLRRTRLGKLILTK